MDRKIWLGVMMIFLVGIVSAGEIEFSINQSEYYFLVGQPGLIALTTDNNYGMDIVGTMSYSSKQEIVSGGAVQSNVQQSSQTTKVFDGENVVGLSFGTMNSPGKVEIDLSFNLEVIIWRACGRFI